MRILPMPDSSGKTDDSERIQYETGPTMAKVTINEANEKPLNHREASRDSHTERQWVREEGVLRCTCIIRLRLLQTKPVLSVCAKHWMRHAFGPCGLCVFACDAAPVDLCGDPNTLPLVVVHSRIAAAIPGYTRDYFSLENLQIAPWRRWKTELRDRD